MLCDLQKYLNECRELMRDTKDRHMLQQLRDLETRILNKMDTSTPTYTEEAYTDIDEDDEVLSSSEILREIFLANPEMFE